MGASSEVSYPNGLPERYMPDVVVCYIFPCPPLYQGAMTPTFGGGLLRTVCGQRRDLPIVLYTLSQEDL